MLSRLISNSWIQAIHSPQGWDFNSDPLHLSPTETECLRPTAGASMPERRTEGDAKGEKTKVKDEPHRRSASCLLPLPLQSQSQRLKRPLQRRERRYPKGKKGKADLARRR
ncbi:Non-histone chromosomal protein HMG-17 [Plecturocebus cupreus]